MAALVIRAVRPKYNTAMTKPQSTPNDWQIRSISLSSRGWSLQNDQYEPAPHSRWQSVSHNFLAPTLLEIPFPIMVNLAVLPTLVPLHLPETPLVD